MGDLKRLLPGSVTANAVSSGNEFVMPYAEALSSIAIATKHKIAVLGLESFEVRPSGFLPIDYSGYDRYIHFTGHWDAYVTKINAAAESWIKEHRLGENHGYILTSASRNEFALLK